MLQALDFINRNKPYIVAVIAAAVAGAQGMGYPTPDWVWGMLGAAGLGAVHHTLEKTVSA